MARSSLAIAAVLCLIAGMALAAGTTVPREGTDAISVPQLINYQGKLTDAGGNLLTGDYDMHFEILDAPSGGTSYWSETQLDVPVAEGLFSVILGSVNPVANLPEGPACYLEITIEGEVITERVRLVSVPYATMAQGADDAARLGGVPAASYATQSWVTSQGYATEAWVNAQGFATQAWVNAGFSPLGHTHAECELLANKDAVNGYCGLDAGAKVTLPKLAQGGAVPGQILGWTGGQWAPVAAGGAGTVTQVNEGTGITLMPNPITTTGTVSFNTAWGDARYSLGTHTHTLTHTGDATGSGPVGGTWALTLANTGVTTGSYTNASITVDAKGRLTAASSGAAGVTGSGTANYVARWTAGTTLGNSSIQDAGGTAIAVGTSPSASYRIYGYYDANRYGYLGSVNYGVCGYSNVSTAGYAGVYGYAYNSAGATSYGVYGYTGSGNYAAPGYFYGYTQGGVFGESQSWDGVAGVTYSVSSYSNSGVKGWQYGTNSIGWGVYGYSYWAADYTGTYYYGLGYTRGGTFGYTYNGNTGCFGVAGYRYDDADTRSGGVLGAVSSATTPAAWGSLGYQNSGSLEYGAYYTSVGTGAGDARWAAGFGMGSYGDLMGGWLKGEVYGAHISGDRYALYTNGNSYTNGVSAVLQDAGAKREATYVPTAVNVEVYTSGIAELSDGQASVKFPSTFTNAISADLPVVVTATPMGPEPVYLTESDVNGFSVRAVSGKGSVKLSWIAVGRRAGYEQTPELPAELARTDFDQKMGGVCFNENDTRNSAQPMWFDGSQLRFEPVPQEPQPPKLRMEQPAIAATSARIRNE